MPSAPPRLRNPAPSWITQSAKLILWHGCTSGDADSIYQKGIDLSFCKPGTDFGLGFYLTSLERQAKDWAWLRYYDLPLPDQATQYPATMRFEIDRDAVGDLTFLAFVLGDYDSVDYWSLVQHCRQSKSRPNHSHHEHPRTYGFYDVASGPVSAFWYQRLVAADADQISFHTPDALALLNDFIAGRRKRGDKKWIRQVA
jgi:hypothetical protein